MSMADVEIVLPAAEQLILAVLTGLGFGYVVFRMGSSPQRLLLMLFALWTLQTGSQFIYRALGGTEIWREVVIVTFLRLTFTAGAVVALWYCNRRH